MDTSRMFLCTVMHPKVLPGPITDPGNPLKVEMLVEIGPEDLKIRAPAASAKGKIMGTEPLTKIERVTIERLGGSTQRAEILRRSLLRGALYGGGMLAFMLVVRSYDLVNGVVAALAVAAFGGLLHFLLNGGLGNKREVVRFHFTPSDRSYTFYLEVPPSGEHGLHQALLDAGLSPVELETNQQM